MPTNYDKYDAVNNCISNLEELFKIYESTPSKENLKDVRESFDTTLIAVGQLYVEEKRAENLTGKRFDDESFTLLKKTNEELKTINSKLVELFHSGLDFEKISREAVSDLKNELDKPHIETEQLAASIGFTYAFLKLNEINTPYHRIDDFDFELLKEANQVYAQEYLRELVNKAHNEEKAHSNEHEANNRLFDVIKSMPGSKLYDMQDSFSMIDLVRNDIADTYHDKFDDYANKMEPLLTKDDRRG